MFYLASNSYWNRRAVVFMKPTIGKNFLAYFSPLCVCVCACSVCFYSRSWVQKPPDLFVRNLKTCLYIIYIYDSSIVLFLKLSFCNLPDIFCNYLISCSYCIKCVLPLLFLSSVYLYLESISIISLKKFF